MIKLLPSNPSYQSKPDFAQDQAKDLQTKKNAWLRQIEADLFENIAAHGNYAASQIANRLDTTLPTRKEIQPVSPGLNKTLASPSDDDKNQFKPEDETTYAGAAAQQTTKLSLATQEQACVAPQAITDQSVAAATKLSETSPAEKYLAKSLEPTSQNLINSSRVQPSALTPGNLRFATTKDVSLTTQVVEAMPVIAMSSQQPALHLAGVLGPVQQVTGDLTEVADNLVSRLNPVQEWDTSNMHSILERDELRLWLRDVNLQGERLNHLLVQLVGQLNLAGIKVSKVFLNGKTVFNADTDVISGLPASKDTLVASEQDLLDTVIKQIKGSRHGH